MITRFFFFTVFIHFTVGQQFQCPLDENSEPINGTFPDPTFCNIYYHCIGGVAYSDQCPVGLAFTVTLKNCRYSICVDPENAKCPENSQILLDGKQQVSLTSLQEQKSLDKFDKTHPFNEFECDPAIDGTFPNPTDCRQYYHCVQGRAWPHQCPFNFVFNPTLNIRDCNVKVCVPREAANCPQSGGWSQWSEFGECFPNCGSGVKARYRECNNPPPVNGGLPCQGNNVDIVECSSNNCTLNYTAFYVSNRRSFPLLVSRHMFNKVYLNDENLFNLGSSSVRVQNLGYYWFTLVVTSVDYRGRENDRSISSEFWRDLAGSGAVTDEINSIMLRTPADVLNRYSYYRGPIFGSEDGAETSWLGYKIDSTDLYFAQRTSNAVRGIVSYSTIKISSGIIGSSTLTVAKEGYYYIAFSFRQDISCSLTLRINQQPIDEMLMNFPNSTVGKEDMNSKSLIVKMNSGDRFDMYVLEGTIKSDSDRQLSMSAYRLNKITELVTVIRNSDFSSNLFEKLSFDYELHNIRNSWDSINNQFKCKSNGLYKVSLSLGIKVFVQTFAEILVNGKVEARLFMARVLENRYHMISRTSLFKLRKDDTIHVQVRGSLDNLVTKSVLNIVEIQT